MAAPGHRPDAGGGDEGFMTIGEFAERTHLSQKALRLYDELGLVRPARVDPNSGYRRYTEDQVENARLVALCRGLDMPLAVIGPLLRLPPADAAQAVAAWWDATETRMAERRTLVTYLQARLLGEAPTMHEVSVRSLPERQVLSISRHVTGPEVDAFFHEAFPRLRRAGTGLEGIAGCPYLIFYGEVSADSDGPVELCRPVGDGADAEAAGPDAQLRREAAHEEAYVGVTVTDATSPGVIPAIEDLLRWVTAQGREPAGYLRQVFRFDQSTAGSKTVTLDMSMPLK
jgi:DNA-binding transcriptional MerR regulator